MQANTAYFVDVELSSTNNTGKLWDRGFAPSREFNAPAGPTNFTIDSNGVWTRGVGNTGGFVRATVTTGNPNTADLTIDFGFHLKIVIGDQLWYDSNFNGLLYVAGNPASLALWPIPSPEFRWWQVLTYALLHGNWLHMVINLLALLSFAPSLERAWGRWRFLACYALAAVFGGTMQALVSERPVVGASAALFGLFAAWTCANPHKRLLSIVPWPLEAWMLLLLYVNLTMLALTFGWLTGVAHVAHLGGAVVGLLFATNNKACR